MATGNTIEVTDATFGADVLEESYRRPVVVDFWAEWCAPCRTLGPILEKLAAEHAGAFLLAKLDVDANPQTAGSFAVQGIPAVKAFVGARLADEFTGAMPEDMVRRWLDPLLPGPADDLLAEAIGKEASGDLAAARVGYEAVLEADAANTEAAVGLARVDLASGDVERARERARALLPDPQAERLLAVVEVAGWRAEAEDSPLGRAKRDASAERWQEALEAMLALVGAGDQAARETMLEIFRVLGDEDPLTKEFRAKLASALF